MLNGAVNIKKIVPPSRREKVFRAAACLAPNGSQPAWPPDSADSNNSKGGNYDVEFAWIDGSNTPSYARLLLHVENSTMHWNIWNTTNLCEIAKLLVVSYGSLACVNRAKINWIYSSSYWRNKATKPNWLIESIKIAHSSNCFAEVDPVAELTPRDSDGPIDR